MTDARGEPGSIIIVTPVFNDWESFRILVAELSRVSHQHALALRILAVDDGSSQPIGAAPLDAEHIASVEVIRLACNLGHQRAIAIGLVEASKRPGTAGVIVMDCDGEDRVEDIPRLVAASPGGSGAIVVATRASRSEGFGFRLFYVIYKFLFRQLVGSPVDFGNFSYVPRPLLGPLVHSAGIWNHLAASISRSRLPIRREPCPRGRRYAGQSHMNFPALLVHGLGAMSVYVDIILARVVTAIAMFIGLLLVAATTVVVIRFTSGLAVPGWATNALGLLSILLIQSFVFMFTFAFILLNLRTIKTVIPLVDGPHYIDATHVVKHAGADNA